MKGKNQSFAELWSPDLAREGFTAIPNRLIERQAELGLTDKQFVTLVTLIKFTYGKNTARPSIRTISEYVGQGYSTVQKKLKQLELKGFIKRKQMRNSASIYDISPTIIKLRNDLATHPPRKRGDNSSSTMRGPPSSKTENKEDVPLKRISKTDVESIKDYFNRTRLKS